jgi:predicted ester cyclase
MSEANKALARRMVHAFATADTATIEELLAKDFVQHSGGLATVDSFVQQAKDMRRAFPDLSYDIEPLMAEGDLVTAHLVVSGTHLGPLQGIEPTGRKVTFAVIDIWRFEGGKVVEHWGFTDQLSLLLQLGLAVGPPTPQP